MASWLLPWPHLAARAVRIFSIQRYIGFFFSFVGDSNITATVSSTDTMTITLNSNISGLNSISGTTINATSTLTENNVRVATQPFAIAQSIALG